MHVDVERPSPLRMSAALVAALVHKMLPPPQPTPVYVTVPPAVVSTHRSLAYVVMVAVYGTLPDQFLVRALRGGLVCALATRNAHAQLR